MPFHVDCRCGRQVEVRAADAGGEVTCPCGNVNAVPSLSALRRRAGLTSYEGSIAGTIRRKLADGELPLGDLCARCGMPTEETLQCSIECERTSPRASDSWATVLLGAFTGIGTWLQLQEQYLNTEVTGRELVVEAPLRVCADCRRRLRKRTRRNELRALLKTVPEYAELLREYPHAGLDVT